MKKNDSSNPDNSNIVVKNRLLNKIRELNLGGSDEKYSTDINDYEVSEVEERTHKIYRCKFIEKETQREVMIEIKSLG